VDPRSRLGDVIEATFTRPLSDSAYRRNALAPGGLPLEVSFSEEQPDQLRLDLQPFDVDCSPPLRRDRVLAALGTHAGTSRHDRSETWLPYASPQRFGAFLAAVFGPEDLTTVKAYLELDPALTPRKLPRSVAPAAALVAEHVAGVVPHLVAIADGGNGTSERVYLACPGGLRILSLDGLLTRMGIGHRMPALATAVAALTGGRLLLPEDSALIAVGERASSLELKIELLSGALAGPEQETLATVERLLTDRPASLAAFRRWRRAVGAGTVTSVVSVRLCGDELPLFNVYQRIVELGRWRR
jgi:hypothetical protein